MKNSQEIFSYPIVVIESIWPKLPEEAPKLVGPNNQDADSAYIYSETQNAFGGYFKIIPLNIKNISVSASKTGHKFDIVFDSSYVYIQINPRYVSRSLYNYVIRNSFKYTQKSNRDKQSADPSGTSIQDLHYLSGILEGYSKSGLESDIFEGAEHYFVPGTVISKIINEMDTVTIFLIQDLSVFSQDEIIKIGGGGFSRRKDSDILTGTKKLSDLGIVKPLELNTAALTQLPLAYKLSAFRSLLTNNAIGRYSVGSNADFQNLALNGGSGVNDVPTPYVPLPFSLGRSTKDKPINTLGVGFKNREAGRNNELNILDLLKDKFNESKEEEISAVLGLFGTVLSSYLYDLIKTRKFTDTTVALKFIDNLKAEVFGYYAANSFASYVPWSFYKSVQIVLKKYAKNVDDVDLSKMIKTAAIDSYFALQQSGFYTQILQDLSATNNVGLSSTLTNEFNKNINSIKGAHAQIHPDLFKDSKNSSTSAGNDPKTLADDYKNGLESFFQTIILPLSQEDEKGFNTETVLNSQNISNLVTGSDLKLIIQDIQNFQYPISCETPYFALNGHITKITDTFSISEGGAEKSISISGQGFELPMQTHNIYHDPFDMAQKFFKTVATMTIANATPIAAALSIMAIHMPDYPQYFSRSGAEKGNALNKELKDQRNFDLYKNTLGYFVEKGAILRKNPITDEFLVYAPLHYIDKSFLKVIKSTFDSTLIASQQIQTDQRNITEGPVFNTLQGFLSNSSMYSFFIDEFGTMKIRFEPSAVAQTTSTILSPTITDSTLKSLSLTTDSSQIYNMVEVVPKNFSGLTEGALKSGFYGRATAPDITEVYGLYKELDLKAIVNDKSKKEELFQFLSEMMQAYKEAMEAIRKDFNSRPADKRGNVQLINPLVREKIITYKELEDFFDIRNTTIETESSGGKTEDTPKTDEEKASDEPALSDDVGPPTDLCAPEEIASNSQASSDSTPQDKTAKPTPPSVVKLWEQVFTPRKHNNEFEALYKLILIRKQFKADAEEASVIPFKLDFLKVPGNYNVDKLENLVKGKEISIQLGNLPANQMNYYTDYLTSYLILKLKSLYKKTSSTSGVSLLRDVTLDSLSIIIDLIATFFYFGLDFSANNGKQLFDRYVRSYAEMTNNPNIENYVSWMMQNINLFYYPETLSELKNTENVKNISERESRRVPIVDYKIQEMQPQNISADYFRYGLRNLRQEDYYSTSMKYTEFRAETLRKLHEYPMKMANITVMLNPIYKVGSTVLLVSEKADNNKGTYINGGLQKTFDTTVKTFINSSKTTTRNAQALEPQNYQLILRVDDIVKEGKETLNMSSNALYTKLTNLTIVNEQSILNHFSEAINFILEKSKGAPVPADAYVPLLGIYNKNKKSPAKSAVDKYLSTLVKFHTAFKEYEEKFGLYINLYEELENSIVDLYKVFYPEQTYSADNFNNLNNLLRPQNYHAVQYHINSVSHSWSFGKAGTTNIGGNFGIPALVAYIPTTSDYDFGMHILGHVVTRGPNFPYNESGTENKRIRPANPAFQFAYQQMITEERFYKSKYRYNIGIILERIRRKYTMPEVYGELLSFGR